MKTLEDFLRPTQEGLFNRLREKYRETAVAKSGGFLLIPGEAPILLVAHLDTVHKEPVRTICRSEGGNILMSPQGIGGDDRCGVYGIVKVHEASAVKPWLLFTCDEETGGHGAHAFCDAYMDGELPEGLNALKMVIELDRRGRNDAVYYDCDNPEFEEYIKGKGFQTNFGSFSDISIIAPILGAAAANLSCGYYNAHTLHEYINRRQLKATVRKVVEMVSDTAREDFPRHEYMEADWAIDGYGGYWDNPYDWYKDRLKLAEDGFPKDLPEEYRDIYEELLDLYDPIELEHYRKRYGDPVILELYEYEYGMDGRESLCQPQNSSVPAEGKCQSSSA